MSRIDDELNQANIEAAKVWRELMDGFDHRIKIKNQNSIFQPHMIGLGIVIALACFVFIPIITLGLSHLLPLLPNSLDSIGRIIAFVVVGWFWYDILKAIFRYKWIAISLWILSIIAMM